ncbi:MULTISPECIES: hypothetical protein [unclassified Nocardiopsis]|uniref:hypothetical protein n=1 Tax=Nocardiopsis TaxID=2013 RepID=UPI00387B623C
MSPPGLRLARALTAAGQVIQPRWHRALLDVDRAAFIPDTVWITAADDPGFFRPVGRDDPDRARWVHEDYALATQVDDGHPAGGPNGEEGWGRLRTSGISQPSLVVDMLQWLDARPGHRVLEIGTGTGYNTALLCHALGEGAVVSVEVDKGLAETAIGNLTRAGYTPTVLDDDGMTLSALADGPEGNRARAGSTGCSPRSRRAGRCPTRGFGRSGRAGWS